jgi:hypothetical protein
MTSPPVDDHVRLLGHVALDTQVPVARLAVDLALVEVVVVAVIDLRLVALGAQVVLRLDQLKAVHVVAVAAPHVILEHLALDERAVDVHLFQDLAVGVIQPLSQLTRHDVVQEVRSGVVVVAQLRPARMARRAQFHLVPGAHAAGPDDQLIVLRLRAGHGRRLGPCDVP